MTSFATVLATGQLAPAWAFASRKGISARSANATTEARNVLRFIGYNWTER